MRRTEVAELRDIARGLLLRLRALRDEGRERTPHPPGHAAIRDAVMHARALEDYLREVEEDISAARGE